MKQMTNREWLMEQMQNMSDEEFAEKISIFEERKCEEQECRVGVTCAICKAKWLKAEHKEVIKLSDVERVILENILQKYKWIVRDKIGNLKVFEDKPKKDSYIWWGANAIFDNLSVLNHLFQFIKWSDTEPYNIEELLKGE